MPCRSMSEPVTAFGFSGATWKGWAEDSRASGVTVTSRRLDAAVPVRSRLFPKMRSWFALGAPIELLSPLSVLRLLLILVAVVWGAVPALCSWPQGHLRWTVLACGLAGGLWLWLLVVRQVGPLASHMVVGSISVLGAVVLWSGSDSSAALAVLLVLVPVATFVGLFLGVRAVFAHTGLIAVSVFVAEVLVASPAVAGVVAGVAGATLLAGALTVWLLVHAVQTSGAVDPDTGLPTGTGVARRLAAWTGDSPALVAVVALSGLADARDALGYSVATELLRRAVEDIGQVLPSDAVIGRIASDELVVAVQWDRTTSGTGTAGGAEPASVLGPVGVPQAAGEELAALLSDTIGAGHYLAGLVEVALRGHVGTALGVRDGPGVAELVRRAALAARSATAAGDRSRSWDGADGTLSADDLALLSNLRLAAERGELWMAFQPQVAAATGQIVAVEALLRWDSPAHGVVPPGRFIPLAERTGLVDRLTEWVFATSLDAAARWYRAGMALPVSVNVSARTVGKPDLAEWILGQIDERGLPPGLLTVEVTETAAVDLPQAVRFLRPLHERGVRVSMDDFGTGYTSLAALPYLPLDELKVDMGFVRRSATSAADEAIVRSVRELAHRLGLTAVAEGVEDESLYHAMRDIGYDLLQGYHFARPMTEHDLVELLGSPGPSYLGVAGGSPGGSAAVAATEPVRPGAAGAAEPRAGTVLSSPR